MATMTAVLARQKREGPARPSSSARRLLLVAQLGRVPADRAVGPPPASLGIGSVALFLAGAAGR